MSKNFTSSLFFIASIYYGVCAYNGNGFYGVSSVIFACSAGIIFHCGRDSK